MTEKVLTKEEQEVIIEKLRARIPQGWGKWVSCDSGWLQLLNDLDTKLSYLYPDYEIRQVKEKFGTLRFYCGWENYGDDTKSKIADDLVRSAENKSGNICELCGAGCGWIRSRFDMSVALRSKNGWYKTVCKDCAIKNEYPIVEEEE